ncbi:MAG: serine/threonine-protein kinase [Gammaproteobacteria bacterium]
MVESNGFEGDSHPSRQSPQQANQAHQTEQGTRFGPAIDAAPETGAKPPPAEQVSPPQQGQASRQTLNNRFVLEEQLGSGGMGTVYRALDLRRVEAEDRNPYVAVKILSLQFQTHPSAFIALQREAKKAQSLAHPNIVTVYDFDRDGSTVYMTMEYLPGKSLRERIKATGTGGMPAQEALPLIEGMGKALIYAHEKGIVHCDFKPANVFANARGQVKVIDFGIARAFKQAEDDTEGESTRFDPGSLRALTPTYASPEMLEDHEPDPRDDIYALGCITYEMLAGHHPFDGLTSIEARYRGLIPKRVPGLTGKQWRALRAALALEREQRTPTVTQFLEQFMPSPRRLPWLPMLTVILILFSVISLYQFRSHWQPPSRETIATAPSVMEKAGEGPLKEDRSLAIPSLERNKEPSAKTNETARMADEPPVMAAVPSRPSAEKISPAALSGLLERIPCSALTASLDASTVTVKGFASDQLAMARLQQQVLSLPGVGQFSGDIQTLNVGKCDVLEFYAPYWIRNKRLNLEASISTVQPGNAFVEGESLVVNITTPAYPSYVNIDYFTLDGEVVHLIPSPEISDNQAPPNYQATLGDLGEWRIAPPFGKDLIALLITPEPLFELPRPPNEQLSDYLTAVTKRLQEMETKDKPSQIAADLLLITTQSRSSEGAR